MDIIAAIVIFLAVLILESYGDAFFDHVFFSLHNFLSKLVVAFLVGFIVFVLLTDRVPKVYQKVTIIIVSLLLIYANLFLGKKKEKTEGKERGH